MFKYNETFAHFQCESTQAQIHISGDEGTRKT